MTPGPERYLLHATMIGQVPDKEYRSEFSVCRDIVR